MDLELELFGDLKEKTSSLGKLYMLSLSSQPVDHEDSAGREKVSIPCKLIHGRSPTREETFCLFMHRRKMRCTTPRFFLIIETPGDLDRVNERRSW